MDREEFSEIGNFKDIKVFFSETIKVLGMQKMCQNFRKCNQFDLQEINNL